MKTDERSGRAYSYLRFSTKKQERGDSIRRQTDARDGWLKKHPHITMAPDGAYEELGASSFRGKHRDSDKTALRQFITAVESGRVKTGSYLIVESFDRLTREEFGEAAEFVLGLVNRGIKIVQLSPVEVILERPVDLTKALILVVELTRGHGESKRKSEIISGVWESKRKESRTTKKAFTVKPPSWLVRSGERFEFRPGAKALVRRMFTLTTNGFGCRAIAAQLNREKVPTWESSAAKWQDTLIRRIVRGREVLGEYQPKTRDGEGRRKAEGEAIAGYYPAAVTEAEWRAAEVSRMSRQKRGGRPPKNASETNLFTGLLRDGLTGDTLSVHRRHKAQVLVPRGFQVRGEKGASFPLVPFERGILEELAELDPREVLDTGKEKKAPNAVAELRAKLARIDATLAALADQFDNPEERPQVIGDKVKAKNAERKATLEALESAEALEASPISAAWGDCQGIVEGLDATPPERLREVRLRLKAALARMIESITCVFEGDTRERAAGVRIQFHGSEQHRDYIIVHRGSDGRSGRGASTHPCSLAEVVPGDPDLREGDDARRLRELLRKADLRKLAEAIDARNAARKQKSKGKRKGK